MRAVSVSELGFLPLSAHCYRRHDHRTAPSHKWVSDGEKLAESVETELSSILGHRTGKRAREENREWSKEERATRGPIGDHSN